MESIRETYNMFTRMGELLNEAGNKRLILEDGRFFYNPKMRKYDNEMRDKLRNFQDEFYEKMSGLLDIEESRGKFIGSTLIAYFSYLLLHPINAIKIRDLS